MSTSALKLLLVVLCGLGLIFVIAAVIAYGSAFAEFFPQTPGPSQRAEYGQLGDYFGGILNPLLAFLSFVALLFTIAIQSQELAASREVHKNGVRSFLLHGQAQ